MAGRRSPQSSSISQLTSQPETISSCYRRSRHTEFQPHSGRHRLVAPVELKSLPRREAHRHIGLGRNPRALVAPSLDKPMHAVVGAVIAASAQFFEHTLRRAALPLGQVAFLLQDIRQNLDPVAKLGRGLNPALVLEFGPVPADDLAYRRARHRQRAYDFLDRPTLLKIGRRISPILS